MTAPIISRLTAARDAATGEATWGELTAQIASYHARIGEFDAAEAARSQLREHFSDGRHGRVSIRLMCLDALLLYYRALSPAARDRMLRANLIAGALKQRDLHALTASWLAHVDFNLGRYTEMAKWLADCFDDLDADDGTADLRVSVVLGDSFQFADRDVVARRWYDHARLLASKLGDQAAVGALTYNRAALHVAVARLKALREPLALQAVAMIDGEVRSAVNYQAIARLLSLDHLLQSAAIGVLMLRDRPSEALPAIDSLVASKEVSGESPALQILLADRALCLAHLGRRAEAEECLLAQATSVVEALPADDRAIVCGSRAACYSLLNDTTGKADALRAADAALTEHRATIEGLLELLSPYEAGPRGS
jgi:hypothetical protein